MFLAEIKNAAAKSKTVAESYSAGNGDTIIVDPAPRVSSDGLYDFKPGFYITLPAAPADGDTIRVIVKGYGHATNAVSIRGSHPIDYRIANTTQVPDGTWNNVSLGDKKSLILDSSNLETLLVYDGTNNRWDTNISTASSNLNYRRLRLTETELAAANVQLVTIATPPAMWDNPFQYDATIAEEDVEGWSGPTACANWLGYVENKYGFQLLFGDGANWPDNGTAVFGDSDWHDHNWDNVRPANTVAYATQDAADTLTDWGWYIGTNGTGALETQAFWNAATATKGTTIGNMVVGFRAWLSQINEGLLQPTDLSISYNTQDIFPDPAANEGYAATLMQDFNTNFATVRTEIAADRPFFACWRHWNLTEAGNANKLPPEIIGGDSLTKSLPIKFYDWATLNNAGPNGETYYVGGADNYENSVGHWTLVVGYIETGAGYATTADLAIHPHLAPNSKYLLVIDELHSSNIEGSPAGVSSIAGVDARNIKAIPVIENGVTTNRANLLATVFCQISNATFAV